jgi:hypothetical protein
MEKVHYPANSEKRDDKVRETLQTIPQPFLISLFRHHPHHRRRNKREYD